jgi:hypothetical protein
MAESCGLNPKGIVVWKLGGVDTLPPALLAEYTYGIYPDHGPTRTALSQSNAEYTITLNSMTISRTAGQLPPVRITQSVEGSLPIIWYMNTPDPMRLARTGSMMSFLQSINLACGTNKFAKTIALKALKTLIVQQKDPIPGTMVPQPTNFVHAFRLILRRFAKTSDDPYHALLLNAAANDLSVESFPEAWNVWKAMLDTFKEKTAAFDGPMAYLVDHPSWKQALLEQEWTPERNAIGHTPARFKRTCVGSNGILECISAGKRAPYAHGREFESVALYCGWYLWVRVRVGVRVTLYCGWYL